MQFWAYLWGIETTADDFVDGSVLIVLSLPMRNWNVGMSNIFCPLIHTFWAYLWGIETWYPGGDFRVGSTFWAYLWGIETW